MTTEDSTMHALRASIMYEARTHTFDVARDLTLALPQSELPPTSFGPSPTDSSTWDERAAADYLRTLMDVLSQFRLFRTKSPQYIAALDCTSYTVNELSLRMDKPPSTKTHHSIDRTFGTLLRRRPFVFAYLSPVWNVVPGYPGMRREDLLELNVGAWTNLWSLRTFGPNGLGVTTWFGAFMIERLGRNLLLDLGAVEEPGTSALRLAVHPEPWSASPPELLAGMRRLLPRLTATDMFSSKATAPSLKGDPDRGSRWTVPDWGPTAP